LSERWWRRRKRFDPWFSDLFEETDRLEEMMRQVFGRQAEKDKQRKPYVYGFSMTLGPDGKPQIREFGNVQTGLSGQSRIREEFEPLIDVISVNDKIQVVAELPGVNKGDIKIHSTEDSVAISVETPQRHYYKKLALPVRVDPKSTVASYKNGVLELHLKKIVSERLFLK